jgi:hypothetical protein
MLQSGLESPYSAHALAGEGDGVLGVAEDSLLEGGGADAGLASALDRGHANATNLELRVGVVLAVLAEGAEHNSVGGGCSTPCRVSKLHEWDLTMQEQVPGAHYMLGDSYTPRARLVWARGLAHQGWRQRRQGERRGRHGGRRRTPWPWSCRSCGWPPATKAQFSNLDPDATTSTCNHAHSIRHVDSTSLVP